VARAAHGQSALDHAGSVMPRYTHLRTAPIDVDSIGAKMRACGPWGAYPTARFQTAPEDIKAQAAQVAAEVEAQQDRKGWRTRKSWPYGVSAAAGHRHQVEEGAPQPSVPMAPAAVATTLSVK